MSTYADFDLTFSVDSKANLKILTDEEAIKQSVKILVLTKFYERPHAPEKGSQVYGALFENDSPETQAFIKTSIMNVLETYEPRVKVRSISLDSSEDNTYKINIDYYIYTIDTDSSVSFFLTQIR